MQKTLVLCGLVMILLAPPSPQIATRRTGHAVGLRRQARRRQAGTEPRLLLVPSARGGHSRGRARRPARRGHDAPEAPGRLGPLLGPVDDADRRPGPDLDRADRDPGVGVGHGTGRRGEGRGRRHARLAPADRQADRDGLHRALRQEGEQLSDVRRFSQTAYAVYDPKTGRWSKWQILEMPDDDKFNMARNACAQWLVQPDGTLLVPIYFAKAPNVPASVTVLHCAFDGQKLTYLKHGDELSLNVVRGLVRAVDHRLPGSLLPDDPQRHQGLRDRQRRRPALPADQAVDVRRRQRTGQLQHAAALAGAPATACSWPTPGAGPTTTTFLATGRRSSWRRSIRSGSA